MTAPQYPCAKLAYRNPHASSGLSLNLIAVPNTSAEQIVENIKTNTARDELKWLNIHPLDNRPAIFVGGGPSAAEFVSQIRSMQKAGAVVFAMNGSSAWLQSRGIWPDWQVISDAKAESASLVDPVAKGHLLSSVVDPATMNAVPAPIVWHPIIDGIEQCFPEHRQKAEYTLIGGTTVGTCALCCAHTLGHREFHIFGFDSCHRGDASHAYPQPMNDSIPNVQAEWCGKTYLTSIDMKGQAERFPPQARVLQELGCKIEVYGDGLLQDMWRTPPSELSEQEKYRYVWTYPNYRDRSYGEEIVDTFLDVAKPDKEGRIIDFGCGTGRAGLKLDQLGYHVVLVDFADNCRDQEAIFLQFVVHDLTEPLPFKGDVGFCSDVMEHIPTDDVETVLQNIFDATGKVFFSIATIEDDFGQFIGAPLHNTVKPPEWWAERIRKFAHIDWQDTHRWHCRFLARKKDA